METADKPATANEINADKATAFAFEREKWLASLDANNRDYGLRLREFESKERDAKRARWTNPLTIAIVSGSLAALANIWATTTNAINSQNVERNKLSQERTLAIQKIEEERIFDSMKAGSCKQIKERLTSLDNLGLFTDGNRVAAVRKYVNSLKCDEPPATSPTPAPQPPFELSSDWLGGGHNQGELCQVLRAQAVAMNPGKSVVQIASREESRKDWIGVVQYRYYCTFQAQ